MMLYVWRYPHSNLIIEYISKYQYLICNITAGIFRKIACNVNSVLKQ